MLYMVRQDVQPSHSYLILIEDVEKDVEKDIEKENYFLVTQKDICRDRT